MDNRGSIKESMNDEKMLTLKADLLVWYNFNQKCKEIERKILPNLVNQNGSLKKMLDSDIKFDSERKNGKKVAEINKKAKEKIITKEIEIELRKEHQEYVENIKEKNTISKDYSKIKKLKKITDILIDVTDPCKYIAIGVGVISIIIMFFAACFWNKILLIISLICFGLCLLFIGLHVLCDKLWDKAYHDPAYENYRYQLDYNKWLNDNVQYIEYQNQIKVKVEEYFDKVEELGNESIVIIRELRKIRDEIIERVPLPEKYRGDKEVAALLTLVMDGRATTLKEAINLYEEILFRNEVLRGLEAINSKLGTLNQIMVQGFSAVIASQIEINNRLTSISMTNQVIALDAIWND